MLPYYIVLSFNSLPVTRIRDEQHVFYQTHDDNYRKKINKSKTLYFIAISTIKNKKQFYYDENCIKTAYDKIILTLIIFLFYLHIQIKINCIS